MIKRTITINPANPIQVELYFSSFSNARKNGEPFDVHFKTFLQFDDDFNQRAVIPCDAIISDLITDVRKLGNAHGELEIAKMYASEDFEVRVEKDEMVKQFAIKKVKREMAKSGMHPMAPPPQPPQEEQP